MYFNAGLSEKHRQVVLRGSDNLEGAVETGIVYSVFEALTEYICPGFPSFAVLISAISALKKKDFGMFADYEAVWLPLTVLDSDCVRYRTCAMQHIYKAMAQVRMSDLTMSCLQTKLQLHGLRILFLCNGSFLIGETKNITAFSGSLDHVRREKVYSAIDTSQYPVRMPVSLEEIWVPTIDLSPNGAEKRLFGSIESMCYALQGVSGSAYPWLDQEIEAVKEKIV